MVAAQVAGQLALVLVMPVLTRMIETQTLGIYQAALALGLVLQPLGTLRTEFLLPSLSSEAEYARVLRLALLVLATVTVATAGVAGVALLVGDDTLSLSVLLTALLMFAYGWTMLDNAAVIRRGNARVLAYRNLLAGSLSALFQLIAAFIWPTALALALAIVLGRGIAIGLTRPPRARPTAAADHSRTQAREWWLSRSILAVLSGMTSSAAVQALVLFTGVALGPTGVAYIGTAQRTAGVPLGLLSQGLSQATQLTLAPLIRNRDPRALGETQSQVRRMAPLSAGAALGLALLGPLLAEPVFGSGWQVVGWIVALLAVPSSLQLLFAPLIPVYVMLGRERLLLGLQIMRLGANAAAMAVAYFLSNNMLVVTTAYAVVTSAWYILAYLLLVRTLRTLGD